MKMQIVYIDDQLDFGLSRYMKRVYCGDSRTSYENDVGIEKEYREITFSPSDGYEALLEDPLIKAADIILVDNQLFARSDSSNRFSGKQFKVLFRALAPFAEVLVITQYKDVEGYGIIHKHDSHNGDDATRYYETHLRPALDDAVNTVLAFDSLSKELKGSEDVSNALVERILLMIEGENKYASLNELDIDELIETFRSLEEMVRD